MSIEKITYKADEKSIDIYLAKELLQNGLTGMARLSFFEEDIPLILKADDDTFKYACIAVGEDGQVPRIFITAEILEGLRKKTDFADFIFLHEICHVINADYTDDLDGYDERRQQSIENGIVIDMELRADRFAADFLGITKAVCCLDNLLERDRQSYSNENSNREELDLSIKELKARKIALG